MLTSNCASCKLGDAPWMYDMSYIYSGLNPPVGPNGLGIVRPDLGFGALGPATLGPDDFTVKNAGEGGAGLAIFAQSARGSESLRKLKAALNDAAKGMGLPRGTFTDDGQTFNLDDLGILQTVATRLAGSGLSAGLAPVLREVAGLVAKPEAALPFTAVHADELTAALAPFGRRHKTRSLIGYGLVAVGVGGVIAYAVRKLRKRRRRSR